MSALRYRGLREESQKMNHNKNSGHANFLRSVWNIPYIRQIAYFFLSGFLTLVFAVTLFRPLFFAAGKYDVDLQISVCTEKNKASWGHDVRIVQIQADDQQIDLAWIAENTEGWSLQSDTFLLSNDYEHTAPIVLHFEQIQSVSVQFYGQEGSGIVKIQSNQKVKQIDLYHADGWNEVNWSDSGRNWVVVKSPARMALAIGWFFVFLLLLNCICENRKFRKPYTCLLTLCYLCTLLAFAVEYGCTWETNDDATIAFLLSRTNNDYCPFIGQLLTKATQLAYAAYFSVNWWFVIQLIVILIGSFEILHVLCNRLSPIVALLVSFGIFCLTLDIFLLEINFTRTSILISTGGAVLIADSVLLRKRMNFGAFLKYLLGCLSMLVGQQIRSSGVWPVLAGLAAVGLAVMLANIPAFTWSEIKKWIPKGCLLWAVVFLALGGVYTDKLLTTPEQAEYLSYNQKRSDLVDYSSRYTNYQENGNNLSREDLEAFLNWHSEDPTVFTSDKLDATIKSGHAVTSTLFFKSAQSILTTNCLLITIVLLCTVLLLVQVWNSDIRHGITSLFPLTMCALLSGYLIFSGRLPQRVFQPLCFMTIIYYLILWGNEVSAAAARPCFRTWEKKTCFIFICIFPLCAFAVSMPKLQEIPNRHTSREIHSSDKAVLDYINSDYQNIYLLPIQLSLSSPAESSDIWETVPANYCDNLFFLGGWTAKMPYKVRMLQDWGITNPTKALIENDHVYTIVSPTTTDFLRRNYDPHITISGVKEISGWMIAQYTAPVSDLDLASNRILVHNLDIHEEAYGSTSGWRVTGYAGQAVNETLYCNITLASVRYTYRIETDADGYFSVFFYDIPDGADTHNIDAAFYQK